MGFEIPGLGTFHGPDLTPDPTGLGTWTEDQIVTALRTGVRPDGSQMAPAMPWIGCAALTDADAVAIAAYLESIPPVANKVPGPFSPGEATGGFVKKIAAP